MFKNLSFKYKILLIPGVAALIFVLVLGMNSIYSKRNEMLLSQIVSGYVPALEMHRDLRSYLDATHELFNQAVQNGDIDRLGLADNFRDRFQERIEEERNNPTLDDEKQMQINRLFLEYYILGRETANKLIDGQEQEQHRVAWNSVDQFYNSLMETLDENIRKDTRNLSMSFGVTRRNNRTMMGTSLLTILVSLCFLIGFSVFISRNITSSLAIAIDVAHKVADGDLTVEVPETGSQDEAGLLLQVVKKMVSNLRDLSLQIKSGAQELAAASGQISSSVSQIAAGATETATAASQTSTTVEEVRQTALDSNRKAKHVSESSQKAVTVSQAGENAVTDTIDSIHRIETQMASLADSILSLSEHGQAIGEIIMTVEDVAEQSRLLAVNASIEAVKAGEHGKGFAVVAQEVRTLAEQSKQATSRVRTILDDIKKATAEAVMKTEQGAKAVNEGVKQSAEAGKAIKRLTDSVVEAAQATTQISVSSQEQLVGMDQVVSAMVSIKQASSQNVMATKQVESATRNLQMFGQKLTQLMNEYIL